MRLKLIILLIIVSSLVFGQDSLHKDSSAKPTKSYVKKAKKNRKKNKIKEIKQEKKNDVNKRNYQVVPFIILGVIILLVIRLISESNQKHRSAWSKDERTLPDAWLRMLKGRRGYYREIYLKSEEWKRKRYVVLRRDNWRCVHCGARATQVHHKRYAPKNIGKEPIEWLESVCKSCHDAIHR